MKANCFIPLYIVLFSSVSLTLAQTPNINQQAVDTLTTEVARAVFSNLKLLPNNLKAAQIYNELTICGGSCDATAIIQRVDGYDPVELKMQELSKLKNTAEFIVMSPKEASVAIRKQLAQFYARYKNDNNYSKSLSPSIQEQILTKIDGILLPTATPASTSMAVKTAVTDDANSITPVALQQNQFEPQAKETELWKMILSAIVGLLVGAGAIYLFFYRAALAELEALLDENNRLRNSLETAQRAKAGENVNTIRVDYRQKASAYDAIVSELGTDNPIMAIRQLKQQSGGIPPKPTVVVRSGEPFVEPGVSAEPEAVREQPVSSQTPDPIPAPARSEVVYFPPPDPNGQFDLSQKSGSLSPESAYRFSIGAENPAVASFRFEADPGRLARFLTYRNYMIEPACDSENSYTTTHTRIVMRRDGEAVLENGVWRVKTKALIRYE